jgi:hypothetical protein
MKLQDLAFFLLGFGLALVLSFLAILASSILEWKCLLCVIVFWDM